MIGLNSSVKPTSGVHRPIPSCLLKNLVLAISSSFLPPHFTLFVLECSNFSPSCDSTSFFRSCFISLPVLATSNSSCPPLSGIQSNQFLTLYLFTETALMEVNNAFHVAKFLSHFSSQSPHLIIPSSQKILLLLASRTPLSFGSLSPHHWTPRPSCYWYLLILLALKN